MFADLGHFNKSSIHVNIWLTTYDGFLFMRFPDQKKMLLMKFLNAKKNASYEIPTFQTCVLAFHAGGITFYKMKNHLWNHPKC